MTARRSPVWRRHPWLSLLFVLAVTLALGFGARTVMLARHWDGGPPVIEPWMTPRYLVHSFDIDPELLAVVLEKRPGEGPRDTLEQLAKQRGVPVGDLTGAVQALIDARGPPP